MVAPETARLNSMREHLSYGDILFDVGAEKGDQSVLYSAFVGAQSMCLFESEPRVWPNIRHEFYDNGLPNPMACYVGLVSNVTASPTTDYDDHMMPNGWPACAWGHPTTDRTFRYIHQHTATTKQTRLDDWMRSTDIVPTAITMDIEGAEYIALLGAENILATHRPLVWVSIHPDLMERDYESTPEELYAYMTRLGYTGTHLGTDHEEHHFFQ